MSTGIVEMNIPLTTSHAAHDNPAFKDGGFATIKSKTGFCEFSITPMRSLLADHHIKRLAR